MNSRSTITEAAFIISSDNNRDWPNCDSFTDSLHKGTYALTEVVEDTV